LKCKNKIFLAQFQSKLSEIHPPFTSPRTFTSSPSKLFPKFPQSPLWKYIVSLITPTLKTARLLIFQFILNLTTIHPTHVNPPFRRIFTLPKTISQVPKTSLFTTLCILFGSTISRVTSGPPRSFPIISLQRRIISSEQAFSTSQSHESRPPGSLFQLSKVSRQLFPTTGITQLVKLIRPPRCHMHVSLEPRISSQSHHHLSFNELPHSRSSLNFSQPSLSKVKLQDQKSSLPTLISRGKQPHAWSNPPSKPTTTYSTFPPSQKVYLWLNPFKADNSALDGPMSLFFSSIQPQWTQTTVPIPTLGVHNPVFSHTWTSVFFGFPHQILLNSRYFLIFLGFTPISPAFFSPDDISPSCTIREVLHSPSLPPSSSSSPFLHNLSIQNKKFNSTQAFHYQTSSFAFPTPELPTCYPTKNSPHWLQLQKSPTEVLLKIQENLSHPAFLWRLFSRFNFRLPRNSLVKQEIFSPPINNHFSSIVTSKLFHNLPTWALHNWNPGLFISSLIFASRLIWNFDQQLLQILPFNSHILTIKSSNSLPQSSCNFESPWTSSPPWKLFWVSDMCRVAPQCYFPLMGFLGFVQIGLPLPSSNNPPCAGFNQPAHSGSLKPLLQDLITNLKARAPGQGAVSIK